MACCCRLRVRRVRAGRGGPGLGLAMSKDAAPAHAAVLRGRPSRSTRCAAWCHPDHAQPAGGYGHGSGGSIHAAAGTRAPHPRRRRTTDLAPACAPRCAGACRAPPGAAARPFAPGNRFTSPGCAPARETACTRCPRGTTHHRATAASAGRRRTTGRGQARAGRHRRPEKPGPRESHGCHA